MAPGGSPGVPNGHGPAAAPPPASAPPSGRINLVAQLLGLLMEYHLKGDDDSIKAMLYDICGPGGGRWPPQQFGRWGQISRQEVDDAVACFESWKTHGRVTMPAWYWSNTYKQDAKCFVKSGNPDGTLNLGMKFESDPTGHDFKPRADPKLVRPRACEGWYVPADDGKGSFDPQQRQQQQAQPQPQAQQQQQQQSQPQQQVLKDPQPQHQQEQPGSGDAGADDDASLGTLQMALWAFDGVMYGPDYLIFEAEDRILKLTEEEGWAYGRVQRRSSGKPASAGPGPAEGWYPPTFAGPVE